MSLPPPPKGDSRRAGPMDASAAPHLEGRIVAAHGRHYVVEFPDGSVRHCFPRGKKAGAAVGDRVRVAPQGRDEGAIDAILPRRNLLFRSDETRAKQFAANVDQLLIVVAVEPTFSDDLADARARLDSVRTLGVPIIELSAHDATTVRERLAPRLAGRTTLLLGQSGMGKSTLLNALVPDADAPTREYSAALDMGRHTTTTTRLYHLPAPGGDLIDSPGFQAFGLQHLSGEDILRGFPEFSPHIEHCRFYNCTHRHEPGCGVVAALQAGAIDASRYALYRRILEESEAAQQRY